MLKFVDLKAIDNFTTNFTNSKHKTSVPSERDKKRPSHLFPLQSINITPHWGEEEVQNPLYQCQTYQLPTEPPAFAEREEKWHIEEKTRNSSG
jgi:hypothetical protein